MAQDVARALARALAALAPVRDILDGRVVDGASPAWCEERGWTAFLAALEDRELERCEAEGLAMYVAANGGAPPSLRQLAREVTEAACLPTRGGGALALLPPFLRAVPARKRLQMAALIHAVTPMARRAGRIVDVGAGRGHFTRIAAGIFDKEVLGLEREAPRVAAATALASGAIGANFVTFDACRQELVFERNDLAVGLHACGEVGDRMIMAAARAGCDLALVSCCLQKVDGPVRAPLSRMAAQAGLALRRETLGLTNLAARSSGVETSLSATMEARRSRHALCSLLRGRGIRVDAGEEMRGINRRRARSGLAVLAAQALALRGLPPATDAELREHDAEAYRQFSLMRRLSLPRSMLARLAEVTVVLDRAVALEERGYEVEVTTFLEPSVTPRNIALFASTLRA